MGVEEAILIIDYLLKARSANVDYNVGLTDLQLFVFRQAYCGKSYRHMAESSEHDYEYDYIKQVGSQLWQLLSRLTGKKVSKTNLQAVLMRYQSEAAEAMQMMQNNQPASTPDYAWGEAIDVSIFFDRQAELQTLHRWIQSDRCRLVTLLGMGGMGKTALSVKLSEVLTGAQNGDITSTATSTPTSSSTFTRLYWKSLRDAPTLPELLTELLQFLSRQPDLPLPASLGAQWAMLLEHLRRERCLIVLDNFDALLESGKQAGCYRAGYEAYGELLQRVGELPHRSCVVLTSREKPQEVVALVGEVFPVRVLQVQGLQTAGGQALLHAKGLSSSLEQARQLVDCYRGNPLALKIAATSIQDQFATDIHAFLRQEHLGFSGINALLQQQVRRLSSLEARVMGWLAINREPATVAELEADLVSVPLPEILNALKSLHWRCLIEKTSEGFTQQPVVMEFITEQIIEDVVENIIQGINPSTPHPRLQTHALIKATAKDYIRESQTRMLFQPIVRWATERLGTEAALVERLFTLLSQWKKHHSQVTGYVAGNLLNLLHYLQVDLTGADFSHCQIRQAYLADVALSQVSFAQAEISRCVFSEAFGGILAVAFSPDGSRLAIADSNGEIRFWDLASGQSLLTIKAHAAWIWSIAFSPDGQIIASASHDHTAKLWSTRTGECIHTITAHAHPVLAVTFSPQSNYLATASDDKTIRLWNVSENVLDNVQAAQIWHQTHENRILSLSFSPDGLQLASGSEDCRVRLWEVATGHCLHTLTGHTQGVQGLGFHPTQPWLASASHDRTIKLWQVRTADCLQTLTGHQDAVTSVQFSPDGRFLVSGSHDQTVRLWNAATGEVLKVWQGHTNRVWSVAMTPQGDQIASGGDDHVAKLWDLKASQCVKTFQGYTNAIAPVDITADGLTLLSGHEDETIKLWDRATGRVIKTLRGHQDRVWFAAFLPCHLGEDLLVSGGSDQTIKLWNWRTGDCVNTLRGHQSWIWSVVPHPHRPLLISSSYDATLKVWDVTTGTCLQTLQGHGACVTCVAISPDGDWLASCGFDQTIRLWNLLSGECVQLLSGHSNTVWQVKFSPDGQFLASCSYDQTLMLWSREKSTQKYTQLRTFEGHTAPINALVWSDDGQYLYSGGFDQTVRRWQVSTGECQQVMTGHQGLVAFLALSDVLVSGSYDETIRLWQPETGQCLDVFSTPRPYEGLNIHNIQGLTASQRSTLVALGAMERIQPVIPFRQNQRLRAAVNR